jgi:hypothetical protein
MVAQALAEPDAGWLEVAEDLPQQSGEDVWARAVAQFRQRVSGHWAEHLASW